MQRFSRRNILGWIAGAAALVVSVGLQLGIFNWTLAGVIAIAGLVVVAYWAFRAWEQSRHSRHLRHFAEQHGWNYREAGGAMTAGRTGFPFGQGGDRKVSDVIEGTYSGLACASYTYSFVQKVVTEDAGEQVFSVTEVQLDVPFPRLDLMPEDFGSRLLSAVGLGDIQLESAEFNRAWRVLCADRRFAIDVVDPRMMQALLSHRIPGVAVRIDGARVMAWSAGISHVGDLSRRLNLVTGIARRIPAHVVRHYTEAEQRRRAEEAKREANAPDWAKTGGVLNSRRYTGIGTDANGDGIDDWQQGNR